MIPHAILFPEFPLGWVVKLSELSCIITLLPIISSILKRFVRKL